MFPVAEDDLDPVEALRVREFVINDELDMVALGVRVIRDRHRLEARVVLPAEVVVIVAPALAGNPFDYLPERKPVVPVVDPERELVAVALRAAVLAVGGVGKRPLRLSPTDDSRRSRSASTFSTSSSSRSKSGSDSTR